MIGWLKDNLLNNGEKQIQSSYENYNYNDECIWNRNIYLYISTGNNIFIYLLENIEFSHLSYEQKNDYAEYYL